MKLVNILMNPAYIVDNILPSPFECGLWEALRDACEIRGTLSVIHFVQCQLWFCGTFY